MMLGKCVFFHTIVGGVVDSGGGGCGEDVSTSIFFSLVDTGFVSTGSE